MLLVLAGAGLRRTALLLTDWVSSIILCLVLKIIKK